MSPQPRGVAFTNNSFAGSNFRGNPGGVFQARHRYSHTMPTQRGPGEEILDAVEPYLLPDDSDLQDKGGYTVTGLAKKTNASTADW